MTTSVNSTLHAFITLTFLHKSYKVIQELPGYLCSRLTVSSTEFIRIMYCKNCFFYVLGLLAAFAYGKTFKTFLHCA